VLAGDSGMAGVLQAINTKAVNETSASDFKATAFIRASLNLFKPKTSINIQQLTFTNSHDEPRDETLVHDRGRVQR
jgi:hypothetical protein